MRLLEGNMLPSSVRAGCGLLTKSYCKSLMRACPIVREFVLVSFLAVLIALFLFVWSPSRSWSQDSPCDPDLNQTLGDPNGYRLRLDRCEGIYTKDVAGNSALVIVSLTKYFGQYNPAIGKDLIVAWPTLGNEPVWLRAYSLRRKLYYRMDTVRPAGSSPYLWPSGMLATLNIEKKDVGVISWTAYRVGNMKRNIYLPLRIEQQDATPNSSDHYALVVLSSVELEKVFISLTAPESKGQPGGYLRRDEELGYGYYPPDHPIDIPISGLTKPGIYHLEIGATLRAGGSTATELWFYHPGS
jgi:hypothetical protein